jgi:hypothetical protein
LLRKSSPLSEFAPANSRATVLLYSFQSKDGCSKGWHPGAVLEIVGSSDAGKQTREYLYRVLSNSVRRTIYVRMTGYFRDKDVAGWAALYQRLTEEYEGGPHVVLADLRGMRLLSASAARIVRDAMNLARARGMVCCAQVTDEGIARLRARGVSHEAAVDLGATIDAESVDEAERVLRLARRAFGPRPRPMMPEGRRA